MHENCDFVVSVNILTYFARPPFSWAAQHTTVCLDCFLKSMCVCMYVCMYVHVCSECKTTVDHWSFQTTNFAYGQSKLTQVSHVFDFCWLLAGLISHLAWHRLSAWIISCAGMCGMGYQPALKYLCNKCFIDQKECFNYSIKHFQPEKCAL